MVSGAGGDCGRNALNGTSASVTSFPARNLLINLAELRSLTIVLASVDAEAESTRLPVVLCADEAEKRAVASKIVAIRITVKRLALIIKLVAGESDKS